MSKPVIRLHDTDSHGVYAGGDPVFHRDNLDDLNRLRAIVKKQWAQYFGKRLPYSDYEADKIIASIAPKTRETMIKRAVDGRA